MVNINENIPNFKALAFQNEEIKEISLSDYQGKWLILFFYPGDFTFICPTELKEMAALYPEFKKEGAEVLSISTDSAYVHKAWHDQSEAVKKVEFPMLADPAGKISRAFGTYIEDKGESLRGSFIIDPDQKLKSYELNDNDIGRNANELLRKLQACKFVRESGGEVCPANWHPGTDGLTKSLDKVGKI